MYIIYFEAVFTRSEGKLLQSKFYKNTFSEEMYNSFMFQQFDDDALCLFVIFLLKVIISYE